MKMPVGNALCGMNGWPGERASGVLRSGPHPGTLVACGSVGIEDSLCADRLGRETNDQWVEAPLVLDGKVVGKVSADNEHDPLPTALDLDLLDLFAQQAAAALDKSRLLDLAQRRVGKLTELVNCFTKIHEGSTTVRLTLLPRMVATSRFELPRMI
jgi:hypothetical protein